MTGYGHMVIAFVMAFGGTVRLSLTSFSSLYRQTTLDAAGAPTYHSGDDSAARHGCRGHAHVVMWRGASW